MGDSLNNFFLLLATQAYLLPLPPRPMFCPAGTGILAMPDRRRHFLAHYGGGTMLGMQSIALLATRVAKIHTVLARRWAAK